MIWPTIAIIVVLAILGVIWSCCHASSNADDAMGRAMRETDKAMREMEDEAQ